MAVAAGGVDADRRGLVRQGFGQRPLGPHHPVADRGGAPPQPVRLGGKAQPAEKPRRIARRRHRRRMAGLPQHRPQQVPAVALALPRGQDVQPGQHPGLGPGPADERTVLFQRPDRPPRGGGPGFRTGRAAHSTGFARGQKGRLFPVRHQKLHSPLPLSHKCGIVCVSIIPAMAPVSHLFHPERMGFSQFTGILRAQVKRKAPDWGQPIERKEDPYGKQMGV